MSPRARALAFAGGALACALLAAAAAGRHTSAAGGELGELRYAAVSLADLRRGQTIGLETAREALELRRVPAAFAPPDAIAAVGDAMGRRLVTDLPAGSYVTAAVLAAPRPPAARRTGPPQGTTPVEVEVAAAGGLAAAGLRPGAPVDVVVAGSAGPGPAAARAYVAVRRAPLLGLERSRSEPGLGDRWRASLALTRAEALELIRAETLGSSLRLLAR